MNGSKRVEHILQRRLHPVSNCLQRQPRLRYLTWFIGFLATVGCGSDDATESVPELLIDHTKWVLVPTVEQDPFAVTRGRPTVHACQNGAYLNLVPGTVELELAECRERYVSLHQPSLVALQPGDHVQFNMSHLMLRPLTEDVTEAYVAVAISGSVVWDQTIQIFTVANAFVLDVPVDTSFPMGSDVVLHVDNHGENSYTFDPFVVARSNGAP